MRTKLLIMACMLLCIESFAQIQIDSSEVYDYNFIVIDDIVPGSTFSSIVSVGMSSIFPENVLYCEITGSERVYGLMFKEYIQNESNTFKLALGRDIEASIKSLNSIISIIDKTNIGYSTSFTDVEYRKMTIYHQRQNVIHIKSESDTKIEFNKASLKKAIKLLDKKAEKKVAKVLEKHRIKSAKN